MPKILQKQWSRGSPSTAASSQHSSQLQRFIFPSFPLSHDLHLHVDTILRQLHAERNLRTAVCLIPFFFCLHLRDRLQPFGYMTRSKYFCDYSLNYLPYFPQTFLYLVLPITFLQCMCIAYLCMSVHTGELGSVSSLKLNSKNCAELRINSSCGLAVPLPLPQFHLIPFS